MSLSLTNSLLINNKLKAVRITKNMQMADWEEFTTVRK